MISLRRLGSFAPAALLVLSACGKPSCETTGSLEFDSSVPSDQACLIDQDIGSLDEGSARYGRMNSLLGEGAEGVNLGNVKEWLRRRIRVVVGQDFDTDRVRLTDKRAVYPFDDEATLTSFSEVAGSVRAENTNARSEIKMMAANLGCAIYASGKMESTRRENDGRVSSSVLAVELNGELKEVTSSRFGLMLIGEGFFEYGVSQDQDAAASRIARLATLVHEARHSDGHGHSLCFQHVACPSWHDYAGHEACDVPTNGAYAVGSAFLQDALENCTDCAETEKEQLRMIAADQMSRQVDLTDSLKVTKNGPTIETLENTARREARDSNSSTRTRILEKFLKFIESNQGQGAVTWPEEPESGLDFLR